jgi:hypothetical protein
MFALFKVGRETEGERERENIKTVQLANANIDI